MKNELDVKQETLPNGCQVILVRKPGFHKSLGMLATQAGGFDIKQTLNGPPITYPSGCAHFLEHQMFHYKGGDVTDRFAALQAQTNAFTSFNETAYYFQTTSDVEKPIDLLFDFVEHLEITPQTVAKEKGIILSEYDMYKENVEQRLMKETWRSMYKNHPLRTDILGSREDIQNMTVEQLSRFYRNNYDPSRLIFIGITGKETAPLLTYVRENQSAVPSHLPGRIERLIDPEPAEVVRPYYEDQMDIRIPFVAVGYKLPVEPDEKKNVRMDAAVQMYLDTWMSPLNPEYQTWLDRRILTSAAGAECEFSKDHAFLFFFAQTQEVDAFIKIVEGIIEDMKTKPLDEAAFRSLRSMGIASNIRSTDHYESLALDWIRVKTDHVSFWENLNVLKTMTKTEAEEIVHGLNYDQKCVTVMRPKK
ncbi:MAG: EF-P 5-aminopentanol modification-associated protein YfmH [Catenisphaera adipataccumulans]|jgi:predicted Zn-dependent peptidase|uniref:EF-P 5-aminopentanol modification-associated protein YfmH n=1 Tax=Catenisphaera adipataccumulans TaxID=700500 RepID=UPI003D8BC97A